MRCLLSLDLGLLVLASVVVLYKHRLGLYYTHILAQGSMVPPLQLYIFSKVCQLDGARVETAGVFY